MEIIVINECFSHDFGWFSCNRKCYCARVTSHWRVTLMSRKLTWNVLKSTLRLISFLLSNGLSSNLEML